MPDDPDDATAGLPATVTIRARCCPACGRLRTYCRCVRQVPLRDRVDAARPEAAAARRERLERAAQWDREQAACGFFRARAVRGRQEALPLDGPDVGAGG